MPRADEPIFFKKTGLHLTHLGLGTATQGGLFQAVTEDAAMEVFQAAWDAGIRFFDTAPWYGFGQSEEWLGKFLQSKQQYVLATKVGRLLSPAYPAHPSQQGSFVTDSQNNVRYDYSYDGVMRSFEESLQRMGVDHIDILFIHDPDVVGVEVPELMDGAYRALIELRDQKAIAAFGAGMNQWEMPMELLQQGDFDIFLLAGRYTLLEQHSQPFMDLCRERGAGVVIGGVYNSGLLAKPRAGAHYNYSEVPEDVLQKALDLQALSEAHGVPLRAAAIQFPFQHEAVVSVLTAARRVEQLQDNLQMVQHPLPAGFWEKLLQEN